MIWFVDQLAKRITGLVERYPLAQGLFSFLDLLEGIIPGEHINYLNAQNYLDFRTATGYMTQPLQQTFCQKPHVNAAV
jgi:hypothetical protein